MTPTITPTITPEKIKNVNVEDNELYDNLKELCNSPRKFDTDGEQRALNFLIDKNTEYGYAVETQEFYVYSKTINDYLTPTSVWQYFDKYSGEKDCIGKGKNVISTSANPDEKKTLYITAHYDTTSDTNGILDNGTGVVVAMEIARQLQGIKLPINIEYIFFSAEEAGLQGSTYFVSQLTKEEKENTLGCMNIDVIGQKGDNEVALKTYEAQINVLSLLMDKYHKFPHSRSEVSDHTSFYMGEIPAIYFADEKVSTKDIADNPLDAVDIEILKEQTKIICNFILNFDSDDYDNLLKDSYTKEYTDLPKTDEVLGYSLVQANKVLKDNGAGSDIQYILKNDEGNQVIITEKDNRFLKENEIQNFDIYNEHVKYKVSEEDDNTIVQFKDEWIGFNYDVLEGNISTENALELLNNQGKFTKDGILFYEMD